MNTLWIFVLIISSSLTSNAKWILVAGTDNTAYDNPSIDEPGCRAFGFGYRFSDSVVYVGKGRFSEYSTHGDEYFGYLSLQSGVSWQYNKGCTNLNCFGSIGDNNNTMGARHSVAYAQRGLASYSFGGIGYGELPDNTSPGNELWSTDGSLQWTLFTKPYSPSQRSGSAIWVDALNNIWIFGGKNTSLLNDLWLHNNGNWTIRNPTVSPPARANPASWFANGNLYLYGGTGPSGVLADMWKYNISTNAWTWLSGDNKTDAEPSASFPGGRAASTFWVDNNSFYLFGGRVFGGGVCSDLWSYSISSNTWDYIAGSTDVNNFGDYSVSFFPAARQGAVGGVLDFGVFWIYGGIVTINSTYNGTAMDLWIYDTTGNYQVAGYSGPGASVTGGSATVTQSSSGTTGVTSTGPTISGPSITTFSASITSTTSLPSTSTTTGLPSTSTTTGLPFTSITAGISSSIATSSSITTTQFTTTSGTITATTMRSTTTQTPTTTDTATTTGSTTASATTTIEGSQSTSGISSSTTTQSSTTTSNSTQASIAATSSKKNSSSNVGLLGGIIGGVGGLLLLLLLIALVLIRRRKRQNKKEKGGDQEAIPMKSKSTTTMQSINNVVIIEKIGSGNFGDVYLGKWQGMTLVALKKLKSAEAMDEFNREATMLSSMNHPNVLHFYGVWKDNGDQYIVCEYMTEGALNHYVMKNKLTLTSNDLIEMAIQIAVGMQYLYDTHKVVHRDLSLRNLLVTKSDGRTVVKVSDFGMSRSTENYYRSEDSNKPIRWCAPETLEYGLTDTKTDVYAYGITLWELFSYGKIPYLELDNRAVIKAVLAGSRPEIPKGCPEEVFTIMEACWNEKSENRPTFGELSQRLMKLRTGETTIVVPSTETQNVPLYNTE